MMASLLINSYYLLRLGQVKQPMHHNRIKGRVQEGLYNTDGLSFSKFFTVTTYIGLVMQPMLENRFRGRVQEGLLFTDGFSFPKLFTLN